MAAQATARTEPRLDSSPALDFPQIRDEVMRAYQPATPEESLLATQIARAWLRLQKYYDFEAELIEKQSLSELFETDLARFKALNSAIAAAERMWRQAVHEFQCARRRNAAKPASPPAAGATTEARSRHNLTTPTVPTNSGPARQPHPFPVPSPVAAIPAGSPAPPSFSPGPALQFGASTRHTL